MKYWGADRKQTTWLAALLVALPILSLVPKYVLIARTLGAAQAEVFDTGFGFGDYTKSLFNEGTFRSCTTSPFTRCGGPACNYATRMPVLPLLYAGLATLVGLKASAVAYAKCALTALLAAGFLYALARDVRPTIIGVILLAVLYLGPQALKHGASLEYEEGLLVDIELCLGIAVAYLLRPSLTPSVAKKAFMGVAAVLLATLMYFTKTTALLTLLVVLILVLGASPVHRLAKALAVVCVLVPVVLWGAHTYANSGEVHLSSSWNGENLYRGSSSAGLALYPQISLDRLFDSRQAKLADGRLVPLEDLTHTRCFDNEWTWNGYYAARARAWAIEHPWDAIHYESDKIWVALFQLRHTPYGTLADGERTQYPAALTAGMWAWMLLARAAFFLLIAMLIREMLAGKLARPSWTLALLVSGWAPYLLVFSYQRHLVPLLVMSGTLLAGLYLFQPSRGTEQCVPA